MTSTATTFAPGRPCWVDCGFKDLEKATAFYSELLGWEFEEGTAEFGGYRNAHIGGQKVAGVSPQMSPDQPAAWTTYLACQDAASAMQRATEHGAHPVMDVMPVGDFGVMGLLADPTGAFVGLWQGGTHTGFERFEKTGAVCWSEQWSRDDAAAREFYTGLFGYSYESIEADGMTMQMFSVPGEQEHHGLFAHMNDTFPASTPSYWLTYFQVESLDDALAVVKKHGGSSLHEPMPTPYGPMCTVTGCEGEVFALIQPPACPE